MEKVKQALIYIIICVFILNSCKNQDKKNIVKENNSYCLDEDFESKIEFEQATKQYVTQGIPLTGIVEPNPDRVVHFMSLVSGIISKTYFSLGDNVKKGQVLAELRSVELSELHSKLRSIESQIRVSKKKLESILSMYNDGISSKKELLEAQSELEVLKAERENINTNLSLFSASTERGVFQIKSPTTGIVTAKSISAGTQISAEGESLFTISDLSEVWVLVNVYATNVVNIETGMQVKMKTLSYQDKTFEGEINAISQVLDSESRVLKARVIMQNKDFLLKPGMIVDVKAIKELKIEALSIPTSVIIFDNNKNYVVVHKGNCEIEIREIEIISASNGKTFISSGISEGEKIISKNSLLLYEQIKNF